MDLNSLLFISSMSMAAIVPTAEADKAILNAYLSQSGIEHNVSVTAKKIEKQVLTPRERYVAGYLAFLAKTVMDQKVTIQWGF